jgi:nicotinate-nucleotide adenylyltransferase
MKVGFFGGSFDPPHRGHIALARLAIERLGLDRLLIAPVGSQPFKRGEAAFASFEDRVAMVRLAIRSQPRMEVSLIDAPLPDGRPNYTIDALHNLRKQLNPDDRLYCLMGADAFLTIGKWRQSGDLLLACDFVVGSRPGFDLSRIAATLPENIALAAEENNPLDCLVIGLRSENGMRSRLFILTDLEQDISATEIRQELQAGTAAALDPAVTEYIAEHRLYRDPA